MTDLAAQRIPDLAPGTPEWATKATASKVAAMLGLSPYESPFQLWHRMRGTLPWEADNDLLRRGHYLEPALRHWFADQHPTWQVDITGTWANTARPWQVASPDGIVLKRNVERTPIALLECKTANNDWEWGDPGTDEVPPDYRAQGLWQMDTFGLPRVHYAVLSPYMEFREYVVEYDAEDAAWVREQVQAFMASLDDPTAEPDVDESEHTYAALRNLHPDIDGTQVELSPQVAVEYVHAVRSKKHADAALTKARNEVAREMGTAQRAVFAGITYATRISKQGGTPYVQTARGLTEKEGKDAA